IAHARRLGNDRVHHFEDEADELDLRYRTEALHAQSYSKSADSGFRKRRIEYPMLSEFLLQSFCRAEYAADFTNVFTEYQYVRVTFQLRAHRISDRLDHRHLCHDYLSPLAAKSAFCSSRSCG